MMLDASVGFKQFTGHLEAPRLGPMVSNSKTCHRVALDEAAGSPLSYKKEPICSSQATAKNSTHPLRWSSRAHNKTRKIRCRALFLPASTLSMPHAWLRCLMEQSHRELWFQRVLPRYCGSETMGSQIHSCCGGGQCHRCCAWATRLTSPGYRKGGAEGDGERKEKSSGVEAMEERGMACACLDGQGISGTLASFMPCLMGCCYCCSAKCGAQVKSFCISFLRISKQPLTLNVTIASSPILVCTKLFPLVYLSYTVTLTQSKLHREVK
jgi:hypothetical protein